MSGHHTMLAPVGTLASRAILPEDPGVAFQLATRILDDDRLMTNHHRGLWGYTGSGRDGLGKLTIQSTGVGAGSAGLVLDELIAGGLVAAIRIGTAQSHSDDIDRGEICTVSSVLAEEGPIAMDTEITATLAGLTERLLEVVSIDPHCPRTIGSHPITDLESEVMARLAASADVRFGAVLAVTSTPTEQSSHEVATEVSVATGELAAQALPPEL